MLMCSIDERFTRALAEVAFLVNESLPGRMFTTRIYLDTAVQRCVVDGSAVLAHPKHRHHPAASQFLRLAVEVERRIEHRVGVTVLVPIPVKACQEVATGEVPLQHRFRNATNDHLGEVLRHILANSSSDATS